MLVLGSIIVALGTVILLVALVDEWVLGLRGQHQAVVSEEALHNE